MPPEAMPGCPVVLKARGWPAVATMLRAPLSTTLAGKTSRQRPRLLTPRATHKFGPPGGKQSIHFAGMRRQQSRPRIEWLAR